VAVAAIHKLAGAADDAFEAVRLLIEDETFRRLEPHVADNLRRFTARSAGRERTALAARIDVRRAHYRGESACPRRHLAADSSVILTRGISVTISTSKKAVNCQNVR